MQGWLVLLVEGVLFSDKRRLLGIPHVFGTS